MPNTLTASQALAALRAGTLTSERLVSACLERIAEREPHLQAWVEVQGRQALEQARACDRLPATRPLHGLPLGVKDVLDAQGFPTRCQSPIHADAPPGLDAACVAAARRAGAIILGKTSTSEFAYVTPASTRNPHHPDHTPGGSSSGSAAAVAAQMVPLALATQTGGSTIRPAAYCGIVGFKPSFGLINRAGLKSVAESLDTIGLMARSVDDVALLAGVLAYRPLSMPAASAQGRRIAFCPAFLQGHAQADAVEHLHGAAERLAAAGARLSRVELPEELERLAGDQALVMEFEAARALLPEQHDHPDLLSPALRERLARGWSHSWADYRQALDRAAWGRQQLAQVFEQYDAILTYSACGQAPATLSHAGDSIMNRAWTLLGLPCLTLPTGTGASGLPLGVQFVGASGRDERLLGLARWAARCLPGGA
jgi:Asp-tRNA(Asn)/Glu-tRNA(Gln) amidotransferase A subunit family amidase